MATGGSNARRLTFLTRLVLVLVLAVCVAATAAPAAPSTTSTKFSKTVADILAQPYQPAYAPVGFDTAFAPKQVLNTYPAQDYTTGSVPGNPDHPGWPDAFQLVNPHYSGDGAPLISRLALQKDGASHPGVVVVHGFNTRAKESVVRWAAMMYANGYNVLAVDQRDFRAEYEAGYGWPHWLQTFGWKEAEDVLAGGRLLKAQPGVTSVGVFGFSLGAETTALALALDGSLPKTKRVFSAGFTFSGPADQNTQVYSTAEPPNCKTPFCTYPATSALIALVVPPYMAPAQYSDPCVVLTDAAAKYGTDPYTILSREDAFQKQLLVKVPLLNIYANDDPLVKPVHATMMHAYNLGNPQQKTLLLAQGNHAYFYDRWWQQKAILLYFKNMLPGAATDPTITTTSTVNQTAGGQPASSQLVDLGFPTRAQADALLGPYICDTSRPSPATATLP